MSSRRRTRRLVRASWRRSPSWPRPSSAAAPSALNLAAEALTRAADPAQVRQLRLVLRLLESRVANLAPDRPARVAFRDRSPAERERVLLGWAHVAPRRSAARRSRRSASS